MVDNALHLASLPLRLEALHSHANGSHEPADFLIRPLPHSRHSNRSSFAVYVVPTTPSPRPMTPLELYPPPPHLTPSVSPTASPRSRSPVRPRSPRKRSPPMAAALPPLRQATEDEKREDQMQEDTEVVGHLKVHVVEAKGLAVAEGSKAYVLLQYDRTDSVSREWGAPPASASPADDKDKKHHIRRRGGGSAAGVTTRRVVGGPSPSKRPSDDPSPVSTAFGSPSRDSTSLTSSSSDGSRSTAGTDFSSLPSQTLSTAPPKYTPSATLRPVSPSPPTLPPEVIGTARSPIWNHHATFDVVARGRTVLCCVYDKLAPQGGEEGRLHGFVGACVFEPPLIESEGDGRGEDGWVDVWVPLTSALDPDIGGEIRLRLLFEPLTSRPKLSITSFQLLRLIGQGSFGSVYRVRKRDTKRIYALKVIRKASVGEDPRALRQVWTERKVLEQNNDSPFLCGLKFSFQSDECFFFCLDYKSGGEMFQHLQRDGGRFEEAKVRFYVAEIVLALRFLHEKGVVYRDLKPENCLLDGSGHVVLCDFGLSKILENEPGQKTRTLCGTTSFLAPEVLLDEGYSFESDWWSLGVLLFEMCYSYSPFYAENRLEEYHRILNDEIKIPNKKGYGEEVKDLLLKLLTRDVPTRLGSQHGASEIQSHPFFSPIDWPRLALRQVSPPYKPPTHADDDQPDWNDDGAEWRWDLDCGNWDAPRATDSARKSQCGLVRGFTYRHKEAPVKPWDARARALWGACWEEEEEEGEARGKREKEQQERGREEGDGRETERYKERGMSAGTRRSSCR
ncbi:hypothetical protein JCM10213_006106 [Rhodosporidiobolus nylandii]